VTGPTLGFLAAVKLPISLKSVLKMAISGASSDGSALYS
jgi:hypothetical protein